MDAVEAVLTRRSIRDYTDEPVTPEEVETLLRAAMAAPSAGNEQPWGFVVVDDRARLDEVAQAHPHAAMARNAPLAILVCGDLERERIKGFWVQDCSAAVQNILVAAHGLGLGAVWTGIYPDRDRVEAMQRLFELPPQVIPLALIPVGRPEKTKAPSERYRPERVHRNRW